MVSSLNDYDYDKKISITTRRRRLYIWKFGNLWQSMHTCVRIGASKISTSWGKSNSYPYVIDLQTFRCKAFASWYSQDILGLWYVTHSYLRLQGYLQKILNVYISGEFKFSFHVIDSFVGHISLNSWLLVVTM